MFKINFLDFFLNKYLERDLNFKYNSIMFKFLYSLLKNFSHPLPLQQFQPDHPATSRNTESPNQSRNLIPLTQFNVYLCDFLYIPVRFWKIRSKRTGMQFSTELFDCLGPIAETWPPRATCFRPAIEFFGLESRMRSN